MAAYSGIACFLGVTAILLAIFLASAIKIVPEYQRLQVYRLGRDIGLRGPGLVVLIPVIDRGVTIDLGDPKPGNMNASTGPVAPGVVGETQSSVHREGIVKIGNRSWPAVSEYPIAPNSRVRVRRVILEIEEE